MTNSDLFIDENLKKQSKEFQNYIEEIKKLNNKQIEEIKKKNPYAVEIVQMQKTKEEMSAYIADYDDAHEKVLAIKKRHSEEMQKIIDNQNLSIQEKKDAIDAEKVLFTSELNNAKNEIWEERGEKIADIFGDELVDMLSDYENFEFDMKKVTKRLYAYIIKESVNAMLQQMLGMKEMEAMKEKLGNFVSFGGKVGFIKSFVGGIFKGIGSKHHSGGIVPVGANAELPGTEEQLALLKGGERILSPSENTEYNSSSQSNSSPVVFNNFNVKAWDSKDVQKYLLENRQLLNSITYDGIKNNNSQLRQIVRNA